MSKRTLPVADPVQDRGASRLRKVVFLGPDHDDESLHYMQCGECGQAMDLRKLGDVLHHETPGHKRTLTS